MSNAADERVEPPQMRQAAGASGATDILAGLLFASIGAVALYVSRDYAFGTTLRMGPGFLPRIVAAVLTLLGVALIVRGVLIGGWSPPTIAWRPIIMISAAVVVFALTINRLGLVVASILTVVIGASGAQDVRWKELPFVALGLAAFCAILFGYILKISLPVWPQ